MLLVRPITANRTGTSSRAQSELSASCERVSNQVGKRPNSILYPRRVNCFLESRIAEASILQ
jgi:hypothetical protein